MSSSAAPLRLTNYVRKFARYEYLDLSYDKPIYLDQDPIGLVHFRHPRNPKQDRWRYVDRDHLGKPCFGNDWYLSAQFFQHGFAVVSVETKVGLPRSFHITTTGKPAYRMRFMDAANVDPYGIARVLHPKDPEHWLELDLSSNRFLPQPRKYG